MLLLHRNTLFELHDQLIEWGLYDGNAEQMLKLNNCAYFQCVNISNSIIKYLKMKKTTLCCCFTWIVFIELNFTVAFLLITKSENG